MKILIACEFSGKVRDRFKEKGHNVWSCDIIPTSKPGQHIINDVRNILDENWDMMIAFPPCTYLSYVGECWFKRYPDRLQKRINGFNFFMQLANADINKIALENPRGIVGKWWRKSDQVIQPYFFGDPMTKETHLWLKNLPTLMYTNIIPNPEKNWVGHVTGKNRQQIRSTTFDGIAQAMADQWG
jgi:hypothetical protein